MPARDEQQQIRKRKPVRQPGGERMRFQMIDGDKGDAQSKRDGLAHGHADDQAADQPRARRRGHCIDCIEIELGLGHRLADRGIEQLDMGACGDLRHHAAIGRMQVELRAHDAPEDLAAAVFVPPHQRRRGLVAACLDPKHGQGSVFAVASHGAFYRVFVGAIEGGAETGH